MCIFEVLQTFKLNVLRQCVCARARADRFMCVPKCFCYIRHLSVRDIAVTDPEILKGGFHW